MNLLHKVERIASGKDCMSSTCSLIERHSQTNHYTKFEESNRCTESTGI
jgi:hypothetical protein